ncbi:Hypothetical protein R9X50_00278700 [Acrodontium crateriforme]|uniref:Uncharacterized protein n=1 Tax=Acrodontium crateriforme TaxID=150365 RepID=A0AAQ3M1Z4_9PEZI|nr:Hypothetical protein R9X50_00278700 [Acrodontium crateriforme]
MHFFGLLSIAPLLVSATESLTTGAEVRYGECDVKNQKCLITDSEDAITCRSTSRCRVQGHKCFAYAPYTQSQCISSVEDPFGRKLKAERSDESIERSEELIEKRAWVEDGACDLYTQTCSINGGAQQIKCDSFACRNHGGPCFSVWPYKRATCNPDEKIPRDAETETNNVGPKRYFIVSGTCKVDTQSCLADDKQAICETTCHKDGDLCTAHWPHKHARCSLLQGLFDRDVEA